MIKKQKSGPGFLTGSGHFFNETIELINKIKGVDLFVSKAAEEVLVMYKKGKRFLAISKFIKIILLALYLWADFIKICITHL